MKKSAKIYNMPIFNGKVGKRNGRSKEKKR